jgi:hypothetical protein
MLFRDEKSECRTAPLSSRAGGRIPVPHNARAAQILPLVPVVSIAVLVAADAAGRITKAKLAAA